MSSPPTTTHYRACNLCEAICGIEIEHRGDEIVAIRGDREDPFSRGHGASQVSIASRTGRVTAPLEVRDRVMPGVVSLPHGWGHDRPGTRLATANSHPGASLNDLTDDGLVDLLCG